MAPQDLPGLSSRPRSLVTSSGREPDTLAKSRRSPFSDEHEVSSLVEECLSYERAACAVSVMEADDLAGRVD
jgi:hypothetical protein